MDYEANTGAVIFIAGAVTGIIVSIIMMSTGVLQSRMDASYYRNQARRYKKERDSWIAVAHDCMEDVVSRSVSKPYKATETDKQSDYIDPSNPYMATAEAVEQPELCGGCGAYLSREEIAACAGEACPRYQRGMVPDKKVNIGYTGSLHIPPKPVK